LETLRRRPTCPDPLSHYGIQDLKDLAGCLIARDHCLFVPAPLLGLHWTDVRGAWPAYDDLNLGGLLNVMSCRPDRGLMEAIALRLEEEELLMVLRGVSRDDIPCWRLLCHKYGISHLVAVPGSAALLWEHLGFRIASRCPGLRH